jgi:small subunit ribosomal protein S21
MPISIEVKDGNVSKSMMQLKRTLIREGLFKELKKRKHYMKPSVAKRIKREAAEKQRNKDLKRELRAAQKADF